MSVCNSALRNRILKRPLPRCFMLRMKNHLKCVQLFNLHFFFLNYSIAFLLFLKCFQTILFTFSLELCHFRGIPSHCAINYHNSQLSTRPVVYKSSWSLYFHLTGSRVIPMSETLERTLFTSH